MSSVSYVGIVFTNSLQAKVNVKLSRLLSQYEKAALLRYAMHVVLDHLNNDTHKTPDEMNNKLSRKYIEPLYSLNYTLKKGVFVTIDNQSYKHINENKEDVWWNR